MSEIIKWYSGKNVVVTGATGFVGKCLVEKLLRDCPDIGDVYIMVRNKRGNDFEQRKRDYTKHIVFTHLNEHRPSALDKIKIFEGDLEADELGMDASDRKLIANNASIVFHSAADVRFDRPLRDAYDINIGGTKRMLDFATEFKHLDVSNSAFVCPVFHYPFFARFTTAATITKHPPTRSGRIAFIAHFPICFAQAFVFVSTAYSQWHDMVLEERHYESDFEPELMARIIDKIDPDQLDALSPK